MKRCGRVWMMLALPWLVGCAVLGPPKSEPVAVMLGKMPDLVPARAVRPATLLVDMPETSPGYDTTGMAYTEKPYQLAYFRDNRWVETPGRMIQPLLAQTLQRTGLFRAVFSSPASGSATYVLRTDVLELLQDYTAHPPVLRLRLRLQLFDTAGRVVAGRAVTETETMADAGAYAGAVAANDAVAKALREAADFVVGAIR